MRSSIGRLALSSGEAYDNRHVFTLLSSPKYGTMFRTIAEMTPIGSGRLQSLQRAGLLSRRDVSAPPGKGG